MVTALLVAGALLVLWHMSDRWGKGSGLFVLAVMLAQGAHAEWSPEQVAAQLEAVAQTNQAIENLTSIVGYGVGLLCAWILLNRIRFK